jgi:quercetin dioxygenase-like cupin family protein
MQIYNLSSFVRGWVIGNFQPSLLQTELFEVGILKHAKGEKWAAHYHKIATEYNVLISGKMTIQNKSLVEGDVFVITPNEVANPEFLTDCVICVIKVPSKIEDKYEVL